MNQPLAAAEARASSLALADLQLVAEDHYLDFGAHHSVGRATDQADHTTQQEIGESEEHERSLPREGGRIPRMPGRGRRSVVCVPFRTVLTNDVELQLSGPMRLAGPVVTSSLKAAVAENLEVLKRRLEGVP